MKAIILIIQLLFVVLSVKSQYTKTNDIKTPNNSYKFGL
jgi:hypothetical protein